MDVNSELADFLRRARSNVVPSQTGLPVDDRVRRVPGLRREEVALLAGVSTDYYARLEQGRRITPSGSVLDAIARALMLDETGRAHLGHLVDASAVRRHRQASTEVQRVRPGLRRLLGSLEGNPALVMGRRTDVLATNRLANALLTDFEQLRPRERNYARWIFLTAEARSLFVDWETQARAVVENLRLDFGKHPDDRYAQELIADLRRQSGEFEQWWNEHRVYQRTFGTKEFRHPIVGDLVLDYESLTLPGDPDQTVFIYTAAPESASSVALDLLSSLTQVSLGESPIRMEEPSDRHSPSSGGK